MKIKKLDIAGFKSFVDRTVLHFDHQVTGIVGPNGCGKSNVVDAIKWVMGEQSPQRLRGRAMEDVIFNGSETRGPHGFAEVSITFDNTEGLGPPEYREYAEISVTRRLDRQGNSDYFINRTPVRLMDVTNLFLGTGVGRKAYSIIEQGRIGYIVSSKPEDRRGMIEEAAGVTKFKARKKAAERKMDQTRQNLLRVSDIVTELERNLASLKRQAQKAERYKAYRAEVRDLELLVASHRWLELTAVHRVTATSLDEVGAQADGTQVALRVRDAEAEAERLAVQGLESHVDQAQNRAYELDNQVRMLEGQIQQQLERLGGLRESERLAERELAAMRVQRETLASERSTLVAALAEGEEIEQAESDVLAAENDEYDRRKALASESEELASDARARLSDTDSTIVRAEARLMEFERRRDDANARFERLQNERDDLTSKIDQAQRDAEGADARLVGLREGKHATAARQAELDAHLEALRVKIRESDRLVESLREELATKRSRLRSLEEVQQRFEGFGAGVRALMSEFSPDANGVVGLVADRFACPAESTRALAAALGERVQHVVIDGSDTATRALDFLREGERGRASLVPRSPRRVVGQQASPEDIPGVVGMLVDHIGYASEDEALARHLLGSIAVVTDMEAAVRVQASTAFDGTLVTLAGDVLQPDGTMTGGAGDDVGTHAIELQREIRELHDVVRSLDESFTAAVASHAELRRGIVESQAHLEAVKSDVHDADLAIVSAEKDLHRFTDVQERMQRRCDALDSEIADLQAALQQASEEDADLRAELERARTTKEEIEAELDSIETVLQQRRSAVDEQAARVTEIRVRAAQARQRVEGDRAALDRLDRSLEELDSVDQRLRTDVVSGARQQGTLIGEIFLGRERLSDAVVAAMNAHEVLSAARVRYEDARRAMGETEGQLRMLRERHQSMVSRVNELTLKERELALAMEHLLSQVDERHRVDLRRVIGDYHLRDIPDGSVKARVDELLSLIERMGEINLLAIEEFEEKSQRYDYLTAQRADLEQALTQLDKAIKQMNRESKRLFEEAFEAVNTRFKAIFPRMFGGGRAELTLTNPDDLLESGIDIVAQPPGKKLGSLELMSGGEKALTAVALLFAIFQYRPSPFCLLDEVDAPLDEANIARFNQAIRQMTDHSQFIIVTHSKSTMEFTDVLYGVTMEQPGVSKLVSVELRRNQRPAPETHEPEAAVA